MSMGIREVKVPTFGEQLMEISIETPPIDTVEKVKHMFAEIAEIIKNDYQSNNRHPLKSMLFDHAVGEIVSAQMAVEKVLTMKHYTENENTEGKQDTDK